MNRKYGNGLAIALLVLLLPAIVIAADDPSPVALNSVAEVEILVSDADGVERSKRVPAERVVPGDTVIYSTEFSNNGEQTAEGLVINNPIPEHMSFLAGSAFGPAEIAFSIDGGSRFDRPEGLWLADTGGSKRQARPDEYTHIRWTLKDPLAPGQTGQVGFSAQLN